MEEMLIAHKRDYSIALHMHASSFCQSELCQQPSQYHLRGSVDFTIGTSPIQNGFWPLKGT